MAPFTPGDSSSKITAPRVSTWMTFAHGSVGEDMVHRAKAQPKGKDNDGPS